MINSRTPRPSHAVENIRQLSLSNIGGVDETKAPTDNRSVIGAVNLVNNLDGSFSLRKPLLIKCDWTRIVSNICNVAIGSVSVIKVIPLYTEKDVLIIYSVSDEVRFTIYDNESSNVVSKCVLKWYDYENNAHTEHLFGADSDVCDASATDIASLQDCTYVNTPSTTVLGNCVVPVASGTYFKEYPVVDPAVHLGNVEWTDAMLTTLKIPSYVKIVFNNILQEWNVEVYSALPNRIEVSEATGTYENPTDMVLPAPFALRDDYNASVPAVRSIVPYTYTLRTADGVRPTTMSTEPTTYSVSETGSLGDRSLTGWAANSEVTRHAITLVDNTHCTIELVTYTKCILVQEEKLETTTGASYRPRWFFTIDVNLCTTFNQPVTSCTVQIPSSELTVMLSHYRQPVEGDTPGNLEALHTHGLDIPETVKTYTNPQAGARYSHTVFKDSLSVSQERYVVENSNYNDLFKYNALADFEYTVDYEIDLKELPVKLITESNLDVGYRITTVLPVSKDTHIVLKAMCAFPKTNNHEQFYATWLGTTDGISWECLIKDSSDLSVGFDDTIMLPAPDEEPLKDVSKSNLGDNVVEDANSIRYAPFKAPSAQSDVRRVDVLKISEEIFEKYFTNGAFRFKIVLVKEVTRGEGTTNQGDSVTTPDMEVVATYGQVDFVPVRAERGSYVYTDLGNSVLGNKLYYKHRMYSFGHPSFKNNVYVSDVDSFVTPIGNTINLNASEDVTVSFVVPWKDYLVIGTSNALYLSASADIGFYTKTINTSVGVTASDARTVVPVLNNIMFKSGPKVYALYPNVYAGDDTVLNITELSSPIEGFLEEYVPHPTKTPFAFGTSSEYVLMLPEENCTKCVKYSYSDKLWNCVEFPIVFDTYSFRSLTDITLFGTNSEGNLCEYYYDKTFGEAYGKAYANMQEYGDLLLESDQGVLKDVEDLVNGVSPAPVELSRIAFELDTGQKTDQILTRKQFVESKLIVATDTQSPDIALEVTVYIDGERNVITRDLSTDAAFHGTSNKNVVLGGVLNTLSSGLDGSATKNVLRQLIVRYSGKGNSIRHILRGSSSSNFKLYETYVRYKLLNVKQ